MNTEALLAIIENDTDDLRALARLAGGHPSSFYRGANFDDADLRGEDLRGFNLDGATFVRTRADRTTLVDPKYHSELGLDRSVGIEFEVMIGRPDEPNTNWKMQLLSAMLEQLADQFENFLQVMNAQSFRQFVRRLKPNDRSIKQWMHTTSMVISRRAATSLEALGRDLDIPMADVCAHFIEWQLEIIVKDQQVAGRIKPTTDVLLD